MSLSSKLWVLLLLIMSAGCTSLRPILVPTGSNNVGDMLSDYHKVSMESPETQRRDFLEANDAYNREPNSANTLRLALLLLIPGTAWRDDGRAAQLLSGLDHSPSMISSPQGDLIVLMEKMIQLRRDDMRRCEAKIESMRDERRKLEQKLEGAREEARRADLLQQKLDELRDIDRDLRSKRPAKRSK